MVLLVLNSGSSSVKFSLFEAAGEATPRCLFDAELDGIGGDKAAKLAIPHAASTGVGAEALRQAPRTLAEAIEAVFGIVTRANMPEVEAIGYRVVHPGPKLTDHSRITDEVLKDIEQATAFAPLHDPAAIEVIRAGLQRFPSLAHFACFDTIFHRTMPEEAFTYALPEEVRKQGVRRYGFHGLSCESVLYQLTQANVTIPKRMVIAHLGSGCSVTALRDGQSIDTSMGLTPTGGVVMGTRPGDLDPGLLLYLLRQQKGTAEEAIGAVETMLNHDAGMVALTSLPNDMKAVREAAAGGNAKAVLALKVFTRSITKAIGAYSFLLGGLDAIVFTGGIGEHDVATRKETLAGLDDFGVEIENSESSVNSAQLGNSMGGLRAIHASNSKTAIFVVPAAEDLMIAMHVARMAGISKVA